MFIWRAYVTDGNTLFVGVEDRTLWLEEDLIIGMPQVSFDPEFRLLHLDPC